MAYTLNDFKVSERTHHLLLWTNNSKVWDSLIEFVSRYRRFEDVYNPATRDKETKITDSYVSVSERRKEIRVHINCKQEFIEFAKLDMRLSKNDLEAIWVVEPIPVAKDITLEWWPNWSDRPHQLEPLAKAFELIETGHRSILLDIQTGRGKTYMADRIASTLGKVTAISILPRYIDKWTNSDPSDPTKLGDLYKHFQLQPGDVCVVKRAVDIRRLMNTPKEDLHYKFYVFSLAILRMAIELHENSDPNATNETIPVALDDLFQHLGIGFFLRDEVHQHFEAQFNVELYVHGPVGLNLSATVLTLDDFIAHKHELMLPRSQRITIEKIAYTSAFALEYHYHQPHHIRTTEYGSNMHSHNAIEKSLFAHKQHMRAFLLMLENVFAEYHVARAGPDDKCLIYSGTVKMCTYLQEHFSKKYPDLDIRRYVAGDSYDNLMNASVTFSTLGSAGTAHDIPNLLTVINPVLQKSPPAVLQALGRLRQRPDGAVPYYLYFVCNDFRKHRQYHSNNSVLLRSYVANQKTVRLGTIGRQEWYTKRSAHGFDNF